MKNSLQRQLSTSLAGTLLVFGLLVTCLSFWSAFEEAQERQDDTLREIALLTDVPHLRSAGGFKLEAADRDPSARIIVKRLDASAGNDGGRLILPSGLTAGFHTLMLADDRWRIYVHEIRPGESIAVAQDTASRNQIALGGALLTLLPLLTLIPLLSWLMARIVRRDLQPVRSLAGQVDMRMPGDLSSLPDQRVPEEIMPFIRSINELLARVRQMLLQQQRFIADAAHELRTPLTALSLQAQNLGNAETLESARRRLIPLSRGIARAGRLVEQLLHLSRQQAGDGAKSRVVLREAVQDLIDDLLPMAEPRRVTFRLITFSNPCIFAERYPLHQLLRNALDNAVRYTPPAGEIVIKIGDEGDEVWVQIIDGGPGIPKDERTRVFEPFYRIAGSEGEGSGLGLAIVRDAAARLGGRISLADRSDRPGLIFTYRQRCPGGQSAAPAGSPFSQIQAG